MQPGQNKAPTSERQAGTVDFAPTENNLMKKQLTDARQAPFVWFDIALDDAGLSVFAFRLYCHLARVTSGGKNPFFESLTNAAALCKMSLRSARDAMRNLEQRQMVKRTEARIGYTWIYALTDKAEWIATPAASAGVPRQEVPDSPAASAEVPRQQVPPHVKNKKKKQKNEELAAAAAVPAAAAATHARTKSVAAATAKSKFAETLILDYLDDCKPQNKHRNAGLAHKLWLTGSDDHLIERWQQKRATAAAASTAQQRQEEAASISSSLDLADLLLSKKQLSHQDREWLPDIISLLSTRSDLAGTVDQLKGLL